MTARNASSLRRLLHAARENHIDCVYARSPPGKQQGYPVHGLPLTAIRNGWPQESRNLAAFWNPIGARRLQAFRRITRRAKRCCRITWCLHVVRAPCALILATLSPHSSEARRVGQEW